jgi:hypothetical protein
VHAENLVAQKLPAEIREHHGWKHRHRAINEWERYLFSGLVAPYWRDNTRGVIVGRTRFTIRLARGRRVRG